MSLSRFPSTSRRLKKPESPVGGEGRRLSRLVGELDGEEAGDSEWDEDGGDGGGEGRSFVMDRIWRSLGRGGGLVP